MKKTVVIILLGALLAMGACRKAAQGSANEQAIKQALETYLTKKKNINLQGMKVEYKNLQVAQNHATVDVLFKSSGSGDMSIGFKYAMKKTANGWEVEKSEPTSGSMFGGHATGAPATSETQLPPGHPMVSPPATGGTTSGGAPAKGMEPAHGKESPKK